MAKSKNIKDWKVYILIFPNDKKYVGITSQKVQHRWRNGKGYQNSPAIYNAIIMHEWENIEKNILYTHLTKEEAEIMEVKLITKYKSNQKKYGYNIQNGGHSVGYLSQETKSKISKSKKGKGLGKDNPFYNKTHTAETKAKLSRLAKGRKHTGEARNKISEIQKIKVVQLTKDDKKIKVWDSAKDVEKTLKIWSSSIAAVCKQRRQTAGGFKWCYLGEYNG